MIEERKSLQLGNLKIENVTQRTVFIVGGKGSGKTQTIKMLAYMAGKHPVGTSHGEDSNLHSDLPVVVFDTLNVIPGIESFNRVIVNRKSVSAGGNFGAALNKLKYEKLIISFVEYTQEESAKFMNDLFTAWKPHDMLIFVDEVHEVAPGMVMGLEYSTEFERAVRHWRNKNVGFVLSTQRPAFVSTKVIGLVDFMILYRTTYPNDLKKIKELISGMIPQQTEQVLNSVQSKGFLEGYSIDFIPM